MSATTDPGTVTVRRHLDGLDGIRALAALLVLLFHYRVMVKFEVPPALEVVVGGGWVGVDIFFAISGFILFLPFARAALVGGHVETLEFLRNRMLRILPAFWFNTFVLGVVLAPVLLLTVGGWWRLFTNFSFLMGYLPPDSREPLNGVTWTLCIELAFYLSLPLVARFFVRERWLLAYPAVFALTLLFNYLAIRHYADASGHKALQTVMGSIFGTYHQFAVGMVAAAIWARCEQRGVRLSRWTGLAMAIAGFAGIYFILLFIQQGVSPTQYWNGESSFGWAPILLAKPLMSACAALAVFGVCFAPNPLTRLFSLRPIAYLGIISYGIYLWHYPVGQWLTSAMKEAGTPYRAYVLLGLGTGLTVLISWFSHRFVEEPFLRRKKPATDVSIAPTADPDVPPVVIELPRDEDHVPDEPTLAPLEPTSSTPHPDRVTTPR